MLTIMSQYWPAIVAGLVALGAVFPRLKPYLAKLPFLPKSPAVSESDELDTVTEHFRELIKEAHKRGSQSEIDDLTAYFAKRVAVPVPKLKAPESK